jgi:hypothetical protein
VLNICGLLNAVVVGAKHRSALWADPTQVIGILRYRTAPSVNR